MNGDLLPSWRDTPTKKSILDFVRAVTDRHSREFVEEVDRVAVFDNDGTLWTEQPMYAELVYAPMLELLDLLNRRGFRCWIFSGGGTDFMRTWATDVYGLPAHRVIGSIGETEFRVADGRPELVKTAKVQVINDGPQKPSSIHRHIGQRPILAAGNTDGDLQMLQWTAANPGRSLQLVVHHTDPDREYAYDRDPVLGSGTDQVLTIAAAEHWTVIDMAVDWSTVHKSAG